MYFVIVYSFFLRRARQRDVHKLARTNVWIELNCIEYELAWIELIGIIVSHKFTVSSFASVNYWYSKVYLTHV